MVPFPIHPAAATSNCLPAAAGTVPRVSLTQVASEAVQRAAWKHAQQWRRWRGRWRRWRRDSEWAGRNRWLRRCDHQHAASRPVDERPTGLDDERVSIRLHLQRKWIDHVLNDASCEHGMQLNGLMTLSLTEGVDVMRIRSLVVTMLVAGYVCSPVFAGQLPTLAPFPTVAQIDAAIRAESTVMRREDVLSARTPTYEQVAAQIENFGSEVRYWHGSWWVHVQALREDEHVVKSPRATKNGQQYFSELFVPHDKERLRTLEADKQLLHQQQQILDLVESKFGVPTRSAMHSPLPVKRGQPWTSGASSRGTRQGRAALLDQTETERSSSASPLFMVSQRAQLLTTSFLDARSQR